MDRSGRSHWRKLCCALIAVIATVALPAAASAKAKEYSGPDAGYLVYSVGTVRIGMHFNFAYKRVSNAVGAPAEDWKGKIQPRLGGAIYLKVKNPDFTGEESGHVVVTPLPPGRYEVHDFGFAGSSPLGGSVRWSPAKPFSLPFTIRSGEATYIGSFMRAPSLGTPLQPVLGAAGFFVIADRAERDVPIARSRLPASVSLTPEVTDVSLFKSAVLRSSHP